MRKINKQTPIADFDKIKNKANNWDAITDFEAKRTCTQHILRNEQEELSAYTELMIVGKPDLHIDHYIKKGLEQTLTFDWNNLLVDIRDSNFGACFKDNKINDLKQYNTILNPVRDDAQDYFYYALSGKIEVNPELSDADRQKAQNTIDIFNLQHKTLVGKRSNLIKTIDNLKKGNCDTEEIKTALSEYGFKSVVEQYTNNM